MKDMCPKYHGANTTVPIYITFLALNEWDAAIYIYIYI